MFCEFGEFSIEFSEISSELIVFSIEFSEISSEFGEFSIELSEISNEFGDFSIEFANFIRGNKNETLLEVLNIKLKREHFLLGKFESGLNKGKKYNCCY